jgi:O-antigen ligase
MWLGAVMSEYPKIALKHSGRYSIYLLTFLALLFAIERNSFKKCGQIFTVIYVLLIACTFLDLHGKTSIPGLLADYGLHMDLFSSDPRYSTSFFENRNPYAVASVGVFFWSLANLRNSWILSSLGIAAASYSIVLAGSRNGVLTLVICLLFLLILTLKQIRKAHTAFILVLAAVIIVGIGYYNRHSKAISRTNASLNRLLNVKTFNDLENIDIRFKIIRSALELGITEPPILGSGTKTFGHEVFSKSSNLGQFNNAWHKTAFNSHNAPLTIWIEMGWVGLIAVLIFLWLWFRPALRGPPLLMMPVLAVCVGQILDYFVWEIFFMAFQSFFFAHFAATITFQEMDQSSS